MNESIFASCDRVWTNAHLATFDLGASDSYGVKKDYALGVRNGKIAALMPMATFKGRGQGASPASGGPEVIDAAGAWITPGFIDCHTHLIYGGNRTSEIEMRRRGCSYAEIAVQGGGILSTVRATRAMTESQLYDAALPRVETLMAEGVTTIEIKSGYGLTLDDELKMLRVAREIGLRLPVRVVATLLAAHALPPEFTGRADEYIDRVCHRLIPAAADHLADAVDVFCEKVAFSPEQCRHVFEAAQRCGLPVKGHVEQLSNLGGAKLAASFKALSVDHLEYLDEEGVEAMADAGTVAVLLPGATYFMQSPRIPPIDALRAAGVSMAVATDLNPGTCPLASIRLMMNMASTLFGLTCEESLTGATRAAARALGIAHRVGSLAIGREADFLVWDIEHPAQLVCEFGMQRPRQRVFGGKPCA